MAIQNHKVSVVIPAYRVSQQILSVVSSIGSEVAQIIVVDDCCPEKSGDLVKNNSSDGRVKVVFHEKNLGVGAAMITGYQIAIASGAEIIVKVDGDGQMNGSLIASLLDPILKGRADYAKGNRFFDIEALKNMPKIRILGNLVLSFFAKISTGYWQIFDPNNGFTAVHISALKRIPLSKVSKRYFFESDMLFRLNLARAVVVDVPMEAVYADEKSNLSISRTFIEFQFKHARNFIKRIAYSYYLRDFTLASIELLAGVLLLTTGLISAIFNWINSAQLNQATPTGTLILIAMLILSGMQLLLSFTSYDMQSAPKDPISGQPKI